MSRAKRNRKIINEIVNGKHEAKVTYADILKNPEIVDDLPKVDMILRQMPQSERRGVDFGGEGQSVGADNSEYEPPLQKLPDVGVLIDFPTPEDIVQNRDLSVRDLAQSAMKTLERDLLAEVTDDPTLTEINYNVSDLPPDVISILVASLHKWGAFYDGAGSIIIPLPKFNYAGMNTQAQRSTVNPL